MVEEVKGRFTGNRPQRLDRVIQQFISSQENVPNASQVRVREWIAAGAVEIDGKVKRQVDAEVQPGTFIKIKIP